MGSIYNSYEKPSPIDIRENNQFISDLICAKFNYKDYKTMAEMREIKFKIMDQIYAGKRKDVIKEWEDYIKEKKADKTA